MKKLREEGGVVKFSLAGGSLFEVIWRRWLAMREEGGIVVRKV